MRQNPRKRSGVAEGGIEPYISVPHTSQAVQLRFSLCCRGNRATSLSAFGHARWICSGRLWGVPSAPYKLPSVVRLRAPHPRLRSTSFRHPWSRNGVGESGFDCTARGRGNNAASAVAPFCGSFCEALTHIRCVRGMNVRTGTSKRPPHHVTSYPRFAPSFPVLP